MIVALAQSAFRRITPKVNRIICEQQRGPVNFASFEQAQRYVRSTGPGWNLENMGGGIFVVTRLGQVVGKGMHYNTAIADAESNL